MLQHLFIILYWYKKTYVLTSHEITTELSLLPTTLTLIGVAVGAASLVTTSSEGSLAELT